jgi:NADH:quinone reductase (non-electrogenic)
MSVRHRVVVVGAGFGGLPAVRRLGGVPVEVTLADRRNHHLFQPLLYQVATAMLSPGQIAPYDSLIVAVGAGQSYFGHDELAQYAPGMKTIDDALELRRRIFGAFETAEVASDPEDPASVRVLLLDGGTEPLATFGDRLSGKATNELERLGVELRMNARAVGVDTNGVDVTGPDGERSRIQARTTIWAAGVEASPLAAELAEVCGATVDRAGRIAVLPDLTVPGHPEVFAVGDMTTLDNLPGIAEVAMQGGLHATNTIVRRLHGKHSVPFRYRDLGSVATIARFRAVASVHKVRLSGFPGWVVSFFGHLAFLTASEPPFSRCCAGCGR